LTSVESTKNRHACLLFASGINHGEHIVRVIRDRHGAECGFVSSEAPTADRDRTLARFRAGELKYLCNVNVLTTGFDAPHIDCVAMLRPTMSAGLYYQMCGRGFRLYPGKQDCLVLDFGGNVLRHGPVDDIRVKEPSGGTRDAPAKECPSCHALVATGYARCPICGHVFPPRERQQHDAMASDASVLAAKVTTTSYAVQDTFYAVHCKRKSKSDDPKTMRVDYKVGFNEYKSEWISFERQGYARQKAVQWWRRRSPDPVPATAERAVEVAQAGGLCTTHWITVRYVEGERYERIIGYELGELPEPLGLSTSSELVETPF
jgi:DNA repair protein RadD